MNIHGTRALITGGASGLGFAAARELLAGGGRVALVDLNVQAGAAAIAQLGEAASFHCADVASESAVDAAFADAVQRLGSLDVAVNCAGIATPRRMLGKDGVMPGEFFRKLIEINLVGTLLVTKAAAAAMQKNEPNSDGERGVIVMTASVAAFEGQIGQIAYAASKAGIVGMTLPMARELASSGIRVMTIAPGIFLTPMLAGLPAEAQESLGRQVPFPSRLGKPEEYASLVRQIVENPMLNGETIRLDGAIRMAPR